MTMVKGRKFQDLLKEELKDPEIKKEYECLREEFELVNRIIELRKKAGLTQEELAKKIHTSQPSIARLESGSYRNVSLSFLRKVGNALGVEPHVDFRRLRAAH
jgi:DNA-binding XRE family transcriptional regulator